MKNKLIYIVIICLSFLFSSCSVGLLAVHSEPPFICFKKKCREMAKTDRRSNHRIINSGGRSAKPVRVKKQRSKSKNRGKKTKRKIGGTPRFN